MILIRQGDEYMDYLANKNQPIILLMSNKINEIDK